MVYPKKGTIDYHAQEKIFNVPAIFSHDYGILTYKKIICQTEHSDTTRLWTICTFSATNQLDLMWLPKLREGIK